MKPLGDGFIKLVKMLIAPIVFTTVVVGIAQMGAMRDVGRIGVARADLLRGGLDAGAGRSAWWSCTLSPARRRHWLRSPRRPT